MNACQKYFSACLLTLLAQTAFAQSAPTLGGAASFAVLGGAGVTCTDSTITGAVDSLLTVTQTPTCSIAGPIHQGDATANQAFNSFVLAYDALRSMTCSPANHLSGQLGGRTLAPGVYCFDTTALLTVGNLTLDGPSNATWVFQIGTALTTDTSDVIMAGGGQACNVFWQLGTAATIGTNTAFQGNILAGSAVTFTGTGSSLVGRAMAKTAVTTTGTSISGSCAAQPVAPGPLACSDRVTGGGYIKTAHGQANFGVTGGIRKDAFRGHLTYIDHGTGLKLKSTSVTAYVVVDAKTRHIEGTASIDGVAGTYKVDVTDNGEQGKNDRFAIALSSGYSASGTLAGGNIQLHKRDCDKKAHDRDGDDDDDDRDDKGDRGGDGKDSGHTAKPYGSDDKTRK
jgi:Ice-binding-like